MHKIGDKVTIKAADQALNENAKVYTVSNVLLDFVEITDGTEKKVLHESMLNNLEVK